MIIRRTLGFSVCAAPNGTWRVRARLSMPKAGRVTWWLRSRLAPADVWDAKAARAERGTATAEQVNKEVEAFAAAVAEVFGRFELIERRIPTLAEVKLCVDEAIGTSTPAEDLRLRVSEVFPIFIEQQGRANNWTEVTGNKFRALAAHIEDFRPGLLMQDVDDGLLTDYMAYMLEELGFKNTTLDKQLAFFRWFLRWAAAHGFYSGKSYETFHPHIKGINPSSREIIYLSRDEVRQIMSYTPPPNRDYLGRVRDVFIFCCFSGLRYSDVAKLRRCDVHDGYISVVTQKTADALRIELNTHSAAILAKYRDDTAEPTSPALPVPCNVRMNKYLKELGEAAGLNQMTRTLTFHGNERVEGYVPKWQLLTTHVARRTFVVTALQLGIAPEVIMRWTGHNSYESMKPYIAIVDELKRRSMAKFDDF